MKYAKENEKDIIFVINDVKSDWIIADETQIDKLAEKPNTDEIGKPRRELLTEFEEETQKSIWFYKTTDFIAKLEEQYKPKEADLSFFGKLGVVRDMLERVEYERELKLKHKGEAILIRCDSCGELFPFYADDFALDWDSEVVEDRGMGYDTLYESQESCECTNCGKQICLTLKVWEYPVGMFSMQNIDIDGGEVEESINLEDYISFEEYETCVKCGERAILNDFGLCEQCEAEYNDFVDSDD